MFYPKKFGFTRRRITPEAHNNANAIATHVINSFPFLAFHVVRITQATIRTKKHTIRITVIRSFVSHATNTGKAFASVTTLPVAAGSCLSSVIHFHTNGTSVFSFTQQQISFPSHFVHIQSTFVYPGLHLHILVSGLIFQLRQSAKVKLAIENITNQNNSANSFFVMI
jgi:hypothetical protein